MEAETPKLAGSFGSKTPKVALFTASLAQYEAFLQDVKQCPGGPPAAEVQLHYGLTYHEVLHCAILQAQFLQNHPQSPLKTGARARAKLQACLLMSCSSEGLSEIICWERPHQM